MLSAYFNVAFKVVDELIEIVAKSFIINSSWNWGPSKVKMTRGDIQRLNPILLPQLWAFGQDSLHKLWIVAREDLILQNSLFEILSYNEVISDASWLEHGAASFLKFEPSIVVPEGRKKPTLINLFWQKVALLVSHWRFHTFLGNINLHWKVETVCLFHAQALLI